MEVLILYVMKLGQVKFEYDDEPDESLFDSF